MKIIFASIIIILTALQLPGQVKFNLSYQPDSKVFTVSILPVRTWAAPLNKIGAAQIVLRAPYNNAFSPAITSLVDGVVWADNSYIENPGSAPGVAYISIVMVNGPTDKIPLVEGQETPLFSFKSASGSCPEILELPANDDPAVQAVVAEGFNVTQNLAVLGLRGNAYAGIGSGAVKCGLTTAIDESDPLALSPIQIAPVPADDQVTISWTQNMENTDRTDLVVFNKLGQEVFRETMRQFVGEHTHTLRVKNWNAGLYSLFFQNSSGRKTPVRNLLVVH